jgi:zinc transporter ZupT
MDEEATELLDVLHKEHIRGHVDELAAAIALVDERASMLLAPSTEAVQEEELSEQIDEELHKVMYKLDHCRRLLEGSETGAPRAMASEEKTALRSKVSELKTALAHLQSHMSAPSLDRSTVKEVHDHFDELEGMLQSFHSMSSETFSYWRRGDAHRHPLGAKLPWSLIIPVVIDAFVDGFLIGLSCSLSHHAGLVLAFATCIEMTFLGAAFAATVARCTGASRISRLVTVFVPPCVLLIAAVIGAALGDISSSSPAAFTAFVAFGVVALLFLVTHELLIEAHDAQGGHEVWWINVVLFVGVFVVLLLNRVLPED